MLKFKPRNGVLYLLGTLMVRCLLLTFQVCTFVTSMICSHYFFWMFRFFFMLENTVEKVGKPQGEQKQSQKLWWISLLVSPKDKLPRDKYSRHVTFGGLALQISNLTSLQRIWSNADRRTDTGFLLTLAKGQENNTFSIRRPLYFEKASVTKKWLTIQESAVHCWE